MKFKKAALKKNENFFCVRFFLLFLKGVITYYLKIPPPPKALFLTPISSLHGTIYYLHFHTSIFGCVVIVCYRVFYYTVFLHNI